MDVLDQKPSFSGGAAGRGGGGFYHLSFRSGSRASGSSAHSAYEYATREGEYGGPEMEPAVYTESGHMPSWAQEDPADYWAAADDFERANGRLYVSADFALPQGLSDEDQVALAREFAHELTDEEALPYTLAIHAGRDEHGEAHNPHAHLMFSERQNDGIERSRGEWFKRASAEHPERGGAPKSRTFHGPAWVEQARGRWARLTNEALAKAGRAERVDHRSYARQGIDRQPGEHYGPSAAHIFEREREHDRLETASSAVDDEKALSELDGQIAALEAQKEAILTQGLPEDEPEPDRREYPYSFGAGGRGDDGWGR
jgi:hypothetical protein